MEMQGKVVVVTGAGSGIGRALAQRIAENGAEFVICTDMNADNAAETAASIGEQASSIGLDVSDEKAIEEVVQKVESEQGRIDVFISNAGYGQAGGLDLPTADWEKMMTVHTWSHLAAARAVLPGMVERGSGYLLPTKMMKR